MATLTAHKRESPGDLVRSFSVLTNRCAEGDTLTVVDVHFVCDLSTSLLVLDVSQMSGSVLVVLRQQHHNHFVLCQLRDVDDVTST